jgi:hypothetical protein
MIEAELAAIGTLLFFGLWAIDSRLYDILKLLQPQDSEREGR